MHFAKLRNLFAMALAWALMLVAYDEHKNPRPLATYWAEFLGNSTRPTVVAHADAPQLRLAMPPLCGAECVDEIFHATRIFAWLGSGRVEQTPADHAEDAERTVEFDVLDLALADLAALEHALRDRGITPDRIELSGIGHGRLEVELPPACGRDCVAAIGDSLGSFVQRESQGRWADSLRVEPAKKIVTVYARMNAVVDIVELGRALAQAGFSARTIWIRTGPES
jgi:hypothetical protein